MNHIYSVLWNSALGRFYVTSERGRNRSRATPRRARGRGANRRPGFAALAACVAMAWSAPAWSQAALPQGGQVVSGSAAITQAGPQMTIQQASDKTILNWQSFNIGAGHQVTFQQPDASAVALNRVVGADASAIHGTLQANGRVFLVNPNGMLFGAGANVNVGGLVASTLNIADNDFLQGHYQFSGQGSAMQGAALRNQGRITAADGGGVALLGGSVSNQGTIAARLGSVALAAGNQVKLDFAGDGLLNVQVQQASLNALAENHQLIEADGGSVLMTAKATDAILQTVVNNTGTVRARTVENRAGKIVLLGGFEGGTTRVAGTLDARAPAGGNGGFIETSGAHVKIEDGARVTTLAANGRSGTWLIDPNDFTVARSGGNMTGQQVSDALNHNDDFTIETAVMGTAGGQGDIHINDAITWTQSTLRLNAQRNINVNAVMSVQGNGKLALNYGNTQGNAGTSAVVGSNFNVNGGGRVDFENGGADRLSVNGYSYTVINTLSELSDIQNLGGKYALGSDIDASPTASTAQGFAPIGGANAPFTGVFDGLGHTISRLTINRPNASDVGLFGVADNAILRNIGLVDGSTAGHGNTGALVGNQVGGSISNAYATGSVKGNFNAGGLIGRGNGVRISNAYATGSVTGASAVGGLVGVQSGGSISNSYATGSVAGTSDVGGLVGNNSGGGIINAYATGSVTGNSNIGGLVGFQVSGVLNGVYATGSVSGASATGGLIGFRLGSTISNAYWNTETSGQQTSAGGTRLTTAQMFDTSKWAGFDFGTVWGNADGQTTPYLLNMAGNQVFNKNDLPTGAIALGNRPVLYTAVLDVNQLQAVQNNLSGRYLLGKDIDASATAGWNGGKGFAPLGTSQSTFTGVFDGLGHTINRLTIHRQNEEAVGLFGYAENAVLRNVGLVEGSTIGRLHTGALVGYQNGGSISNAYATGSVTGIDRTGGLVGAQSGGDISNAYAAGSVTGNFSTGGLVGLSSGSISNAYAAGSVTGDTIYTGGLVGYLGSGRITNAYATGSVTGSNDRRGGLVGGGDGHGSISNAYWNTETTGQQTSAGGLGKTSAQMKQLATYANWDISDQGGSNAVWRIYEGETAPLLRSFLTAVTIGNDVTSTYDGTNVHAIADYARPEVGDSAQLLGELRYTAAEKNVGNYSGANLSIGGLYSTQQGYDISYAPAANLRIIPKEISQVTGITAGDRTYDGTTGATLNTQNSAFNGKILGDVLTVAGASGSFVDKNADVGKRVDITGITLGGADARNYTLADTTATATANIAKATIASVSGITADDRTYDGTTGATLNTQNSAFNGKILGDVLTVTDASGSFVDKNADVGKRVNITGLTLGGADARNYTLADTTAVAKANIHQLAVEASITAEGKIYDATTAAITHGQLGGLLGKDQVTLATSGSFSDKNAGLGKTVKVNGTLSGADAGNYRLVHNETTTADIARLAIQGTITADNKTYDGLTNATTQGNLGHAVLGKDQVTLVTSGRFADKNAGQGKAVAVTGELSGADSGNYVLLYHTSATADIDPRAVNAIITAEGKTYDASTAAITHGQLGGLLGEDQVTLATSGSFIDKNAGLGKTVEVNGTLSGADAGNYRLVHNNTTIASIDRLDIRAGITADDKPHDGTTLATTHGALTGVLAGDRVLLQTQGSFLDPAAGATKEVRVSATLGGEDGGNYRLEHNASTWAAIHPAKPTIGPSLTDIYAGVHPSRVEIVRAEASTPSSGCFSDGYPMSAQVMNLGGLAIDAAQRDSRPVTIFTGVGRACAAAPF